MNVVLPHLLKSAYRREPIISSLITIGVVDALIGGFDDSWSLFWFGIGTAGVSCALKWWKSQQNQPIEEEVVVQRYLPPQVSNSPLPMLSVSKKKPPSRD